MGERASGTLHLVGTPIGNLGDITLRAVETLKSVDRVAAEDTRRTRALLSHLGIAKKTLSSLDANAGQQKLAFLIEKLRAGENVAFVTDAGMPGISDPGARLVRAAREAGVPVNVVPGPSALSAAVALSGLVDAPFVFLGFPPRRGGKRAETIRRIAHTAEPVVLFEAPSRAAATLEDLAQAMPARCAAVCRELTKLHEEVVHGDLAALAADARTWRGEIVIVIGATVVDDAPSAEDLDALIRARLDAGESVKNVVAALRDLAPIPKRELYARVQALHGARE
jgi:16S rRNA (cytidine1402-2'-O)-methyltransferase